MTEQPSREQTEGGAHASGTPVDSGEAVTTGASAPPVRRPGLLATKVPATANRPSVRRPECLAGAERNQHTGLDARRRSSSRIWLAIGLLLLVAVAGVSWVFMPEFWRVRFEPVAAEVVEAPSPSPGTAILSDFEHALNRGEINNARGYLKRARAAGAETIDQARQLEALEGEQRNIMMASFDQAERDGDPEAMMRITTEFASLWPEDESLVDLQKRTTVAQNAMERIARIQELRGSYLLNLKQGRLFRAERNLADMSRLGEEVDKERAKLVKTVSLGNGVTITMRFIPKGRFMMGSPAEEKERSDDETLHQVTLSRDFWMSETEVTQAQWSALMGKNNSAFKGPDLPVETVSLSDANSFIERLNEKVAKAGFRLPTEAEWEYACRAGSTTPFNTGAALATDQANYDGNYPYTGSPGLYRQRTVPVMSLAPNAWGLRNMHGNVWEWCADYYNVYPQEAAVDPQGTIWFRNPGFVIRGGGWADYAATCRSAKRFFQPPQMRLNSLGFRVVGTL